MQRTIDDGFQWMTTSALCMDMLCISIPSQLSVVTALIAEHKAWLAECAEVEVRGPLTVAGNASESVAVFPQPCDQQTSCRGGVSRGEQGHYNLSRLQQLLSKAETLGVDVSVHTSRLQQVVARCTRGSETANVNRLLLSIVSTLPDRWGARRHCLARVYHPAVSCVWTCASCSK